MTDHLFAMLKDVHDERSFMDFVRTLLADRECVDAEALTPDGCHGEWANQSIAEFIGAGIAWAEDSDFGRRISSGPANPWALFAQFLWAGRAYE